MSHYDEVFLMFEYQSFMRADNIGLLPHLVNRSRIVEMMHILIGGTSARWWLSTRLLLGLSHDEAIRMGKELQKA